MRQLLAKLVEDDGGLETVEWAIMGALIAVGVISVVHAIGNNVLQKFTHLRSQTAGS